MGKEEGHAAEEGLPTGPGLTTLTKPPCSVTFSSHAGHGTPALGKQSKAKQQGNESQTKAADPTPPVQLPATVALGEPPSLTTPTIWGVATA